MEQILSSDVKKHLRNEFTSLRGDVLLVVITRNGVNDTFNAIAVELCKEFSELSDAIQYKHLDAESDEAKQFVVDSSPIILFNPDTYHIRFMGAPVGEEGRSFVTTIMMLSMGQGVLSESSVGRIKQLRDPREIMVFVTPT